MINPLTAQVNINLKMALNIQEILKMEKLINMVFFFIQMELNIMVSISMGYGMVEEYLNIKMVLQNIKESLNYLLLMNLEQFQQFNKINGKLLENMNILENFQKGDKMVQEYILIQMGENTLENGKKGILVEQEHLIILMVRFVKVNL